jgi:hypothetical protein
MASFNSCKLIPSTFTKKGQDGDLKWMCEHTKGKNLYVYGDHYETIINGYSKPSSRGGAVIRDLSVVPNRKGNLIISIGMPTYSKSYPTGYKVLNDKIKSEIHVKINDLRDHLFAFEYDNVYYSQSTTENRLSPENRKALGAGNIDSSLDVRMYILTCIEETINCYNKKRVDLDSKSECDGVNEFTFIEVFSEKPSFVVRRLNHSSRVKTDFEVAMKKTVAPVVLTGTRFTEPGSPGDWKYIVSKENAEKPILRKLFIFNDNEEQFLKICNKPGGGNAFMRPYQVGEFPRSVGVPTGSSLSIKNGYKKPGYTSVTPKVSRLMEIFCNRFRDLLKTGRFSEVVYSVEADGITLGSSIYDPHPTVKDYIVRKIKETLKTHNDSLL